MLMTDSLVEGAIELREQLQKLFSEACFQLRKLNSSEAQVLRSIPSDLREDVINH